MRSIRLVLVLLPAMLAGTASGQTSKKNGNVKVESVIAAGLLNGSAGASVSLETILGVAWHRAFAGIGTGLDYYRLRSVPVFFDLRYEFGNTNRRFFIYGDAGYHFDWLTDLNKQQLTQRATKYDFDGGLYYDGGAGYAFIFKNKDALLLSGGYTYKKMTSTSTSTTCPFAAPCYSGKETYAYNLSRLVIRAALRF